MSLAPWDWAWRRVGLSALSNMRVRMPGLYWNGGAISHAGSSRTGVNDVFAGVVVAQKVVLGAAGPGELFVQPPLAVLEDASHDPMIRNLPKDHQAPDRSIVEQAPCP